MKSIGGNHFDTVIIGAGMSGLAAGIRLAHYGSKVLILERHEAPGGLNSFYNLGGRRYDVGLHAMTNYVRPGVKGTPLVKLLRQLRLSREDFDLSEQYGSRIAFPQASLKFNNDFALLESEVASVFPKQIDSFRRMVEAIKDFDETALDNRERSAREALADYITDPLLLDMLLLPLMYYGSAQENDMDFSQFVIMFKSIYLEGFSRPFDGVRQVIKVLLKKYKSLGGLRKMNCGVKRLESDGKQVNRIVLDNGEELTATHIISSAGWVETARLCSDQSDNACEENIGCLSFVEIIRTWAKQPREWGWDDTIVFFNQSEHFTYAQPKDLVDPNSGVICIPNNYHYSEGKALDEGMLRVTAIARFEAWANLPEAEYCARKEYWSEHLLKQALKHLPAVAPEDITAASLATDMFTPRTIKHFTGHLGGAVYGSPHKTRDGSTHLKNLYICGTDQGFLGIIGAMLSGISMVNYHILSNSSSKKV